MRLITPINTNEVCEVRRTWQLARHHRVSIDEGTRGVLVKDMAGGRIVGKNTFAYRGRITTVRSKPVRLLQMLWENEGRPVSIEQVCEVIYGRPATLRAMRQTAFRASRVLDRVMCPLVVGCRDAQLFLRRRPGAMLPLELESRSAI
ncbi:MAG: hypothetical protein QM754_05145 [Tepidisphaeraceae bacterium]